MSSDSCVRKVKNNLGEDGNMVQYRFKLLHGCKYCIQNLRQMADRLENEERDMFLFIDPAPQLGRGIYHVYTEGVILTESEEKQFERDFDMCGGN